jgi:hypothetical protein
MLPSTKEPSESAGSSKCTVVASLATLVLESRLAWGAAGVPPTGQSARPRRYTRSAEGGVVFFLLACFAISMGLPFVDADRIVV